MTRMGRPKPEVKLTPEEREALQRFARRRKTGNAIVMRSKIILRCASGADSVDVAEDLGVSQAMVGKWRIRFIERRLDGLLDEPRVGRPRSVTDEDVERVIDRTLHDVPKKGTHWSSRSLAGDTGMSQSAVARIWKAFALRPDRSESFSLSKDPQFVEKVRDVVGLYMAPPENAVVLCVDEKSQMQALDRTHDHEFSVLQLARRDARHHHGFPGRRAPGSRRIRQLPDPVADRRAGHGFPEA